MSSRTQTLVLILGRNASLGVVTVQGTVAVSSQSIAASQQCGTPDTLCIRAAALPHRRLGQHRHLPGKGVAADATVLDCALQLALLHELGGLQCRGGPGRQAKLSGTALQQAGKCSLGDGGGGSLADGSTALSAQHSAARTRNLSRANGLKAARILASIWVLVGTRLAASRLRLLSQLGSAGARPGSSGGLGV